MHVLVLIAHPRQSSFSHALARAFVRGLDEAGHSHRWVDLYGERFDPVISAPEIEDWEQRERPADVRQHQDWIRQAEGLAFAYPIWWATPPAILQGWLQRVFTEGFAFAYGQGRTQGLLRHRVQLMVNIGSRDQTLYPNYVSPLVGVLNYCGMTDIRSLINWGVHPGTPKAVLQQTLGAAFAAGRDF